MRFNFAILILLLAGCRAPEEQHFRTPDELRNPPPDYSLTNGGGVWRTNIYFVPFVEYETK